MRGLTWELMQTFALLTPAVTYAFVTKHLPEERTALLRTTSVCLFS